ncbi:MAG: endolytic transglycosylase MltG, partial [Endomicrobium sp.]|nr:endolytic transglycosylase MltG [Endomicrobium sp.]
MLLILFSACFFVFDGKKLLVRIQKCATATEIVVHLKEKKNIYSKKMFLILATSIAYQKKFKQRICRFSERTTIFNMVKSLTNSSKNILRVTVPEGENIRQTAEIISKVLKIDKKKFIRIAKIRNMEGYLMPETYFFTSDTSEAEIIDMMYFEFNKKITPFMYERAKKLNLDFKDIIIIASIVEKEAVESNERKIIAAVFLNRLNKKIKLQSCATVLYAMG